MKRKKHISIVRLIGLCQRILDPRRPWGHKLHELTDILVIALLAMVCGCESWEEICDYAHTKRNWLKTILALRNGIPSEATFRRVFSRLKPEALEDMYRQWVTPYVGSCLGKQVCIDGKTSRGVAKRSDESLHIVSAWIREDEVALGQVRTEAKSNEITAIPELLNSLEIGGSVVTIDAMGCQKSIARTIYEREANYVLSVKENHPTLYSEIKEYFDWAITDSVEQHHLSQFKGKSFDHGRTTKWRVFSTRETVWFESKADWAGLRSFIMVECSWESRGESHSQQRFYISSLDTHASNFHQYIRGHWDIENKLHWLLDVAFHEDKCLIHDGFAPQALSLLRKMALTMLRKDTSRRASIARKQKMAGWDDGYALRIISAE